MSLPNVVPQSNLNFQRSLANDMADKALVKGIKI
jgi:hypothetical protein